MINKNIIIGSGMSAYIYYKDTTDKVKIYSGNNNRILKSRNLYEYDTIGGNSNIWGGYINYRRHKKLFKNNKYKNFFKKNYLKVNKIFKISSNFSNTHCIMNVEDEVFRVKKNFFQGNLIEENINNIQVEKNNILLWGKKKKIITKNLILCVGNLNLINLLYKSKFINGNDIISFDDANCNYVLNFFINKKKNYYIPMPVSKILEKMIFSKSTTYKISNDSLILQKFSNIVKTHKFSCEDLLKMNKSKLRYFLSNHVVNLRVNNVPIRKFINSKSRKIKVFCSGTIKKYLPGPVIQDLIHDILNNK